jgi:hypothetical protein
LWQNPGNDNRWLTLRLVGRKANSFGVGGRIEVVVQEGDRQRSVHTLVGSGGSFGASSLQQEIGLGKAEEIVSLEIRWPGSGTVQRFSDVPLDRAFEIVEGEDRLIPVERPVIHLKAIEATTLGHHGHHDATQ